MTAKQRQQATGRIVHASLRSLVSLFILFPIGVALFLSVMQYDLTAKDSIKFVGGQNFADLMKDDYFKQASSPRFATYLDGPQPTGDRPCFGRRT